MTEERQPDESMRWITEAQGMKAILEELRSSGWRVAVHNDYLQDGKDYTFWLFTRGAWYAKGEAATDYEALRRVRQAIGALEANYGR